jgi:hypothetical protein
MPPGRLPNLETTKHFKYQEKPPQKGLVAICKLCGGHGLAKSTYRERKHLDNECPKYEQWKDENKKLQQTKLNQHYVKPIDPYRKTRINEKLAFAMYKTS